MRCTLHHLLIANYLSKYTFDISTWKLKFEVEDLRSHNEAHSMIRTLRFLAIAEGISYLLLLGICMPLKYWFNIPEPTYPVGLAHGVLFVLYCSFVMFVARKETWSMGTTFLALIASLLPFGTFVVEKKLLK